MPDGDSSQEKTEQPTRKKLEDARKEGQTVKSKELTSFFDYIQKGDECVCYGIKSTIKALKMRLCKTLIVY